MSLDFNTTIDYAIADDAIDGTSDAQERQCCLERWAVSPYYRDAWRIAALALLSGVEQQEAVPGTADEF